MSDIAVCNTIFTGLPILLHGLGTAKVFLETPINGGEQIFHFNDELPDVGGLPINLADIINVHSAEGKVCVDGPVRRKNLEMK